MIIKNNSIDIWVIPYRNFVEEHGAAHLDKNIAVAYRKASGRERTRHICSSIRDGLIYAWESQHKDAQEDFKFALGLNYDALRKKYEAALS